MMELPFKYLPFIEDVINAPHTMVIIAFFGTMTMLIVYAMVARLYKNRAFAETLDIIVFSSLGIILILGTVVMMVLLFAGVSGAELYLIWLLIFVAVFIFTTVNINLIKKYIDDGVVKKKS